MIQHEPADAFDPEIVGMFATIGIKKGLPFAPDERMKRILTEAVAVANATARAIVFAPRDDYYATGITPAMTFAKPDTGSAYAYATRDSMGRYLDGGQTYKITLPRNSASPIGGRSNI